MIWINRTSESRLAARPGGAILARVPPDFRYAAASLRARQPGKGRTA